MLRFLLKTLQKLRSLIFSLEDSHCIPSLSITTFFLQCSLPLMLALIGGHGLTEQHLQHVCYCDTPHLHGNGLPGSSGKLLRYLLES